jgi:hypothetical protein
MLIEYAVGPGGRFGWSRNSPLTLAGNPVFWDSEAWVLRAGDRTVPLPDRTLSRREFVARLEEAVAELA